MNQWMKHAIVALGLLTMMIFTSSIVVALVLKIVDLSNVCK